MSNRENISKILSDDINKILKYDADEDEEVTRDEVISYLTKNKAENPEKAASIIFDSMDKNKDNKLTMKELHDYATKANSIAIHQLLLQEVELMLKENDYDKDDKISKAEMIKNLKSCYLDEKSAIQTTDFYFKNIDTDNDGFLTRDELYNGISKELKVNMPKQ